MVAEDVSLYTAKMKVREEKNRRANKGKKAKRKEGSEKIKRTEQRSKETREI